MDTMTFCVHGHFYQPPREDPLTQVIPVEPGAAPYHNWNERINAQCYQPNAELGNFEHISFNIGPTLVEWMVKNDPKTLRLIIEQERKNYLKYGVGNGMAQAYNHTILPLASLEDKVTQVRWGIADFEHHFGHKPLGLWLPETAADDETLLVLAKCGIEFTILAPWQANHSNLDPSKPYRVLLPEERSITVFFYNRDLSTRISFDPGATVNGDRFIAEALLPKFRTTKGKAIDPQMVMVASDGELYGHHQPFRDKFLAYLMDGALKPYPVQSTFPALWMQNNPVVDEVRIHQKSSWSCHHGVTRWEGVCDCAPNNQWKLPLRRGLQQIADAIDEQYLEVVGEYLDDPWELRHQYIQVLLGSTTVEDLLASLNHRPIYGRAFQQIQDLLRAQFQRQRMFTSCGWFFDDFARIEPRNNVAYAAQAVWLTQQATGVDLAPMALELLHEVRSQRKELRADQVFQEQYQRAEEAWQKQTV